MSKRYLIQVAARNLGLMLRKLFGVGAAPSLQGIAGLFWSLYFATEMLWSRTWVRRSPRNETVPTTDLRIIAVALTVIGAEISTKTTGC